MENRGRLWLTVLLCLLVLAGCAGKQPQTMPLSAVEEQEAVALWSGFMARKRPVALDADIRVGWDVLGSKGGVSATLQVQRPALLRFAANDPLGRSLILAVADATSFTMVDNRISHVYRGRIGAKFWQSYVPEAIAPQDLFYLLGGFFPEGAQYERSAQDKENKGFWYQWRDRRAVRHQVLMDRRSAEVQRHLFFDPEDELILELVYADYSKDFKSGFVWPGTIHISGEAVTGTLSVQVEKIYSYDPKGAATFRLVPPTHFTIEEMP